jgi:uncharacterized membrane protein YcaP (DUF421 family)
MQSLRSMIETLFGEGQDLTALQMSLRALVLFFVTLVLVRIGGMRAFGRKSSFDTIILVSLGAVISRAIYGASPALAIVAASLVLVVVHRVVAIAASRYPRFERIIKGRSVVLFRDGEADEHTMRRAGISYTDLDEAVRTRTHERSRRDVSEIRLETSGDLTVLDPPKRGPN